MGLGYPRPLVVASPLRHLIPRRLTCCLQRTSGRRREAFAALRRGQAHAAQEQGQFGGVQFQGVSVRPAQEFETASLQTLVPNRKTIRLPSEDLQPVTPL